ARPTTPARRRPPRAGGTPPATSRTTRVPAGPARGPRTAPRQAPHRPPRVGSRAAPPGAVAPPNEDTDDRRRRDRRAAALAHLRAPRLPDPGSALPRHHPAAAGRGGA